MLKIETPGAFKTDRHSFWQLAWAVVFLSLYKIALHRNLLFLALFKMAAHISLKTFLWTYTSLYHLLKPIFGNARCRGWT